MMTSLLAAGIIYQALQAHLLFLSCDGLTAIVGYPPEPILGAFTGLKPSCTSFKKDNT